jgi:hypothetical protein
MAGCFFGIINMCGDKENCRYDGLECFHCQQETNNGDENWYEDKIDFSSEE